jgi:hypothetical protein
MVQIVVPLEISQRGQISLDFVGGICDNSDWRSLAKRFPVWAVVEQVALSTHQQWSPDRPQG